MLRNSMLKLATLIFVLAPFTSSIGAGNPGTESPRVVEIAARRFNFTPSQIALKKGETVKLVLHSEDVTHGFFMRALKLDEELEPGHSKEVVITPQVAGSFTT